MAGRNPEVRAKGGYWYSEAGGRARRFGCVGEVSKAEATSRLWKALAESEGVDRVGERGGRSVRSRADAGEVGDGNETPGSGLRSPEFHSHPIPDSRTQAQAEATNPLSPILSPPTFRALADAYLAWIKANRSEALHREARRHLGRWCERHGERYVADIRGDDLEAFREALIADGHARMYVQKHATTIKACVNRGVKMRLLPKGFKPFDGIEGLRIPPKALLETDLPTAEEVRALLAHAKPEFGAMLRVYYHTGARTHELIEARAGDYQPKSRSLVMAKHKRSHTLREYRPRTILLNQEANAIIEARCRGHEPDALVFPNRAGNTFTSCLLGDMFARLRSKAGVRPHITIYSLRHLWISEMLMAGHDALIVARMAGTSVKMIESVYGHFRATALADAQAKLDALRAGL